MIQLTLTLKRTMSTTTVLNQGLCMFTRTKTVHPKHVLVYCLKIRSKCSSDLHRRAVCTSHARIFLAFPGPKHLSLTMYCRHYCCKSSSLTISHQFYYKHITCKTKTSFIPSVYQPEKQVYFSVRKTWMLNLTELGRVKR